MIFARKKIAKETCSMNQERLISVIVPVYNAEAYLETCLNSLSWQTFQAYDVWLVDEKKIIDFMSCIKKMAV